MLLAIQQYTNTKPHEQDNDEVSLAFVTLETAPIIFILFFNRQGNKTNSVNGYRIALLGRYFNQQSENNGSTGVPNCSCCQIGKSARGTCCRNSLHGKKEKENGKINLKKRIIYIGRNKLTTVATRVNLITNFAL